MASFDLIVNEAYPKLKKIVRHTPLQYNAGLSSKFNAEIYLKREDLQIVRSYKIRGAYNKITSVPASKTTKGVVCASAGNHAQGVALSCKLLGIKGHIFMPVTTPTQKVNQVKMFGGEFVQLYLKGDTFDDSYKEALELSAKNKMPFIHPFDDEKVIEGQATIGLEILEDFAGKIDYMFVPVGGGGLAAGICTVFSKLSPHTHIIGVEPEGAPSMKTSLQLGFNHTLTEIDKFIDGAAVKRVGDKTFEICKTHLYDIVTVPEGKVCSTILQLYNEEAIIVEPAGALAITALDLYASEITHKTVVCIVSGSNNDISRTEEIRERSLMYEGLKHYFIVRFPQRAGALREFLDKVLDTGQDITHFEYSQKNNRENGPAFIGLEILKKDDLNLLLHRMTQSGMKYEYLNNRPEILQYLL
ncbi:MAG: threonine ammonia-lyase IlvA [Bacteroidetes bacterium]|nr:threonine ammonia-lyase IlvA [Bacteroidota bacterium]